MLRIILFLVVGLASWCGAQTMLFVPAQGERSAEVDPLAGRLYVAQRDVRLYRNRQLAGDLPMSSVVEAQPLSDTRWLRLRHQDQWYEADASAFLQENQLMQDILAREARARNKHLALNREYDRARQRMKELSDEAARWEASPRSVLLVFPAPPEATQRRTVPMGSDLRLLTEAPASQRAAACRHEMRKLSRTMEKLEQQLASIEQETLRMAEIRAVVERCFMDFRLAYHRP